MFRVSQFNVLARSCALSRYFPYAALKNEFWDERTFLKELDWAKRGALLLKQLQSTLADIACLCEVDEPLFFVMTGFESHFKPRPAGRPEGCLILWRSSRFSLVPGSERSIEFPKSSRVASSVELKDLETGRIVRVVSGHLFWDSHSPMQLEEAKALNVFLDTLPTLPTIVCVDLNNTRGSETFRQFTDHGFSDAFTLAGAGPPEFTSVVPDVWRENELQKGRREEIDFIFCSTGLKASSPNALSSGPVLSGSDGLVIGQDGQPRRSESVPPEEGIPNHYHGSDHLPVVCDLSLI
jgi:endonuclease/exonuclease/phosphatase family metal-dependent hydrolase